MEKVKTTISGVEVCDSLYYRRFGTWLPNSDKVPPGFGSRLTNSRHGFLDAAFRGRSICRLRAPVPVSQEQTWVGPCGEGATWHQ